MNKLLLISLSFILLNSCFIKKKSNTLVEINSLSREKTIQDSSIVRTIFVGNDTSRLTFHYNYFLKEDQIWKRAANNYIANFIYTSTHFESDTNSLFKISDIFIANCLDSFYNAALEDFNNSEYPALWFYDGSCKILSDNSLFLSLSSHAYTFTGGAHPNGYHEYANFDKKTGEILKLSDIISDTKAFYKIAEKFFRESIEVDENEDLIELGYWFNEAGFYCNDNFFIGENEFMFYFNTYEIAPYSHGATVFIVPFTLSSHLFKIDLSKK
jgi:hypothetical protein